ncbi:cell division protein FtsZ [Bacteroidia bacterium]|nr:cell division protein FtsZ [Bacteroidia bacterium]
MTLQNDIEDDELLQFAYPTMKATIIKVVGVGGGGGNAVTHMYKEGIKDVSFVLCNTDNQALLKSEVPNKLQLGKKTTGGLGAGNKPDKAEKAAEESIEDLKKMFNDGTRMAFITAGMGGGTGTGAAPIVARVAKEMDILTVGIVTIPFLFEGIKKIIQALKGVEEIAKSVDALLVINNERLRDIYADLTVPSAFEKADDTLTVAAKSISEIITVSGYINLDFADVQTTLKDGGVAIMSSGLGKGENRVAIAIENALHSPLLNNNDIQNAKKILLNITFGNVHPLLMDEMNYVNDFMAKINPEIDLIFGTASDDSLDENVKITILATGFGIDDVISNSERQFYEDEEAERIRIQKVEEEAKREAKRIADYKRAEEIYGKDFWIKTGKSSRPKPFVFKTIKSMDDNETIEALIAHPAYNRNPRIMVDLAKKAVARRDSYSEEVLQEEAIPTKAENAHEGTDSQSDEPNLTKYLI